MKNLHNNRNYTIIMDDWRVYLTIISGIGQLVSIISAAQAHPNSFPTPHLIWNWILGTLLGILISKNNINPLGMSILFLLLFAIIALDVYYNKKNIFIFSFIITILIIVFLLYPVFQQGLLFIFSSIITFILFLLIGLSIYMIINKMKSLNYNQFQIAMLVTFSYFTSILIGNWIKVSWLAKYFS